MSDGTSAVKKTEPAAVYIGVKKSTMEAWRCRGGGPAFVKMGRAVRYRISDLDKFLEDRARTSTSQKPDA